jgi:hypothetical protein
MIEERKHHVQEVKKMNQHKVTRNTVSVWGLVYKAKVTRNTVSAWG